MFILLYCNTAVPQYPDDVNTIRQYIYSDSEVADIECPFQLGLLRNLYEFSWNTVASDGFPESIPDGTQGMYWLEEEKNRTLHVNILAAGNQRDFQCVGRVQICTGSTSDSCMVTQDSTSSSPVITIINNISKHKLLVYPKPCACKSQVCNVLWYTAYHPLVFFICSSSQYHRAAS